MSHYDKLREDQAEEQRKDSLKQMPGQWTRVNPHIPFDEKFLINKIADIEMEIVEIQEELQKTKNLVREIYENKQ